VVVLVGPPAHLDHGIADLTDHVVAAHQSGLVVAGLLLGVPVVGDRFAVRRDQEILALDPGLHVVAQGCCLFDLALQGDPRRGLDFLAVHPQIGGQPAHLGLPGQLDQTVRVGHGEHVRVGRGHVQPGGKTGKAGALHLHGADRARRYQLGAQHAEEIDEADQEVLDFSLFGDLGEILCHVPSPVPTVQ
jgi:hypothetical protein